MEGTLTGAFFFAENISNFFVILTCYNIRHMLECITTKGKENIMEKKIADILSMWNQGIVDSKKAGEMFENLLEENDYPSAVGIAIAKMREC